MAVRIGPIAPGAARPEGSDPAPKSAPPARGPSQAEAMEKPQTLATPKGPLTRPAPDVGAKTISDLARRATQLRMALKAGGPEAVTAAQQALAFCASYGMRRSRGARRQALELCDEVGESVEAQAELADQLKKILQAEGRLHEATGESTLRACFTLVRLLDALSEERS